MIFCQNRRLPPHFCDLFHGDMYLSLENLTETVLPAQIRGFELRAMKQSTAEKPLPRHAHLDNTDLAMEKCQPKATQIEQFFEMNGSPFWSTWMSISFLVSCYTWVVQRGHNWGLGVCTESKMVDRSKSGKVERGACPRPIFTVWYSVVNSAAFWALVLKRLPPWSLGFICLGFEGMAGFWGEFLGGKGGNWLFGLPPNPLVGECGGALPAASVFLLNPKPGGDPTPAHSFWGFQDRDFAMIGQRKTLYLNCSVYAVVIHFQNTLIHWRLTSWLGKRDCLWHNVMLFEHRVYVASEVLSPVRTDTQGSWKSILEYITIQMQLFDTGDVEA